jgi:hypothetical protein
MMGCLSDCLIRSANIHAAASLVPPATSGTIIVIGRDGWTCAHAMRETAGSAAAPGKAGRLHAAASDVVAISRRPAEAKSS